LAKKNLIKNILFNVKHKKMPPTLELQCANEDLKDKYVSRINHDSDSGVDLYVTEDISFSPGETVIVDLNVKSRMLNDDGNTVGYYLYARSSISKTPLIMANSVGIIDKDYRGNIKVALKHVPTEQFIDSMIESFNEKKGFNKSRYSYVLKKDTRIAQICSPTLEPIKLKLVDNLDETERGEGGFGSTGT
jgi:dUTP pyrophosphatase|tara:strand:+ start:119 stop:688 length:570 start_codon:yes stop_codon:yes gene_type:complete